MKRFLFPLKYSIPIILIVCGSLLGIFSFSQEVQDVYKNTEEKTKTNLQILAGQTSVILDYLYRRKDIEDAVITIISQLGSDPNLNVIMLMNEQNIVQVSNHYELRNLAIQDTVAKPYLSTFIKVRQKLAGEVLLSQDKNKLIAVYPILLPVLPKEIQPSRIGILFFEYDLTSAKQQAYNNALRRSLIFNGTLTVFCLGLWVFFELILTRRVSQLVSASNSLADGNLNVRVRLSGSDELAMIAVAFDSMANKIQENTLILEQELAERKIIEVKLRETNEKLTQTNIELISATKAKSNFLANMSHEIRTPLNGVISIAELLAMTNLDPEQRDLVYTIKDSGNTLLTIINDILDFSKNESGKLQLEARLFVLKDVIKFACNLLSQQLENKQIKLEYTINSDIPHKFIGDVSRLRQIFLNLIGNAIKFTEQGNISISISNNRQNAYATEAELLITIKDTGIGIDGDRISKLFQPFTQADASISRKYGGTGLGLAITKNLVNLMGGTIWVESSGNIGGNPPANWVLDQEKSSIQGSTFYFTILLQTVSESEINSPKTTELPKPQAQTNKSPLKILLAEDNKVNQKVATLTLKKLGYKADIANNGLEVLAMLEKQVYDIVLMDIQMPEMDGLTATKKIRELFQPQPYIIALTANALDEDKEMCFNAGMNDFISKPIAMADLTEALKKCYSH